MGTLEETYLTALDSLDIYRFCCVFIEECGNIYLTYKN